jgi:hypothetical protein
MKINNKKITAAISSCQKLKSMVTFIQLKPILDIPLRGFSLPSCPQHSLKALLLLNAMSFLSMYSAVKRIFHSSIRIIRHADQL